MSGDVQGLATATGMPVVELVPQETSMAFAIRHLSVLAYANGFTLWHYKSATDSLETITAADYMAPASDMLTVGDLIVVNAADSTRMIAVAAVDTNTVITTRM